MCFEEQRQIDVRIRKLSKSNCTISGHKGTKMLASECRQKTSVFVDFKNAKEEAECSTKIQV